MGECIFCKIVNGEVDSVKIWEDEEYMALLDLNPNTKGMTLVIPKKHFSSYVFDMNDSNYCKLMIATKKVAQILDKNLNVKRTAMVMEGLGVDHAHVKLYPIYGLGKKFEETWAEDKVYFYKYPGYITTKLGPQKTLEELKKIGKEIRKN